jgi:hypothetical protein
MSWFTIQRHSGGSLPDIDKELDGDSDRAAGIIAAAFLEEHLTDNICVWMIQDEKIQKETFSPGRAIGNFGIKINLGYLMYLYADVARKEPETIKNIRNAFSHKLHVRSFNHHLIKDKCQNLTRWEEVHILMTRTGPSNFEGSYWIPGW